MISNEIELIEFLSKIKIEFGIFDSEGAQTLTVDVINPDESVSKIKMKVRDIMYFTEYGTITLPGQRILEKVMYYVNNYVSLELNKLIDDIFQKQMTKENIISVFQKIRVHVEHYIRAYMSSYIKNNSILQKLFSDQNIKDNSFYNLIDLSKYIKCSIKIEN